MNLSLFLFTTCLALTPLEAQVSNSRLAKNIDTQSTIFEKTNLTAWCVVPFDARKRGPEERAEMLARLGFKSFAYDWRSKEVPTFDAEVEALNKHGIRLIAWWFPTEADDLNARTILEVIKRHGIHPQLWVMGAGLPTKAAVDQAERTDHEAQRIRKIVELAAPYGCSVELYNHNGWFWRAGQ